MSSYELFLDDKSEVSVDFISRVRREIQRALATERKSRKITQQSIAEKIGVNRSVINRQVIGYENLTLRRVAELLWAIGWEPYFEARKPTLPEDSNEFFPLDAPTPPPRPRPGPNDTKSDQRNAFVPA